MKGFDQWLTASPYDNRADEMYCPACGCEYTIVSETQEETGIRYVLRCDTAWEAWDGDDYPAECEEYGKTTEYFMEYDIEA